jgi:hypothetical protein
MTPSRAGVVDQDVQRAVPDAPPVTIDWHALRGAGHITLLDAVIWPQAASTFPRKVPIRELLVCSKNIEG